MKPRFRSRNWGFFVQIINDFPYGNRFRNTMKDTGLKYCKNVKVHYMPRLHEFFNLFSVEDQIYLQ